ncbi:hypothetical protein JCM1841_002326 [Sporobolomyces salmonicolor]
MHGYFDSISVPLNLPASAFQPQTAPKQNNKGKGKGKETPQAQAGPAKPPLYYVVDSWTDQQRDEMEKKVHMASLLGYSTLLLTLSIPPTFDPSLLSFPTPLFPQLDPRTAKPGSEGLVLQLWRINIEGYGDEAVKGAGQKGWFGFANSTAALYPSQTTLLSLTPTTLTSFSHTALSLSPPSAFSPTLVTLDPSLHPRLPFPLKRGLISSLSRAGVGFELVLRGVTRQDEAGEQAGEAGRRRRNWIAGAREVVRATAGKGVVISSGAVRAGEMRASEDLINLCSLIGLPPAQAKDALTVNPQRAVMRGLSLRQTYRGVLSNPTLVTYPLTSSPSAALTSESVPSTTPKKRAAEKTPGEAEAEAAGAGAVEDTGGTGGEAQGKKRKT